MRGGAHSLPAPYFGGQWDSEWGAQVLPSLFLNRGTPPVPHSSSVTLALGIQGLSRSLPRLSQPGARSANLGPQRTRAPRGSHVAAWLLVGLCGLRGAGGCGQRPEAGFLPSRISWCSRGAGWSGLTHRGDKGAVPTPGGATPGRGQPGRRGVSSVPYTVAAPGGPETRGGCGEHERRRPLSSCS